MTVADGTAPPLPRPQNAALLLDIDGTLIPLAERPEEVVADGSVCALLGGLEAAFDGALVLVSGRPVPEIDRIFSPHRFACAGEHGCELRLRGAPSGEVRPQEGALDGLRAFCRNLARRDSRLFLEEKPHSLSLHYRAVPEHADGLRDALREALRSGADFALVEGNHVFELVPAGAGKGVAIQRIMTEPPCRGRRPFFVGDDTNDEPGFVATNALDGVSVKVGPGASAARFRLPDPAAVRAWLARALASHEAFVRA